MKRELVAESGGTTRTVIVEATGEAGAGALRVTIDGQVREVDARQVRAGTWSLLIDRRAYLVDLEPRRGAVEFGVASTVGAPGGPGVGVVKVEDARARRLAAAAKRDRVAASGETVTAPIAGRIVKVHVAVGDVVAPGTSVVVLEAMKMENELIAERGGTVTKIYRQAGESVDTAEKLVELA
jgi:acetyl-CoA/propionyl-CoA carboxylase biotin carboxyl carrier protein